MTDNPAVKALLNYQQADMDGTLVLTSRQAIHEVVARIEELEAALRYLVGECDEDMDDDYNPHSAPLAQARAALEGMEKPDV